MVPCYKCAEHRTTETLRNLPPPSPPVTQGADTRTRYLRRFLLASRLSSPCHTRCPNQYVCRQCRFIKRDWGAKAFSRAVWSFKSAISQAHLPNFCDHRLEAQCVWHFISAPPVCTQAGSRNYQFHLTSDHNRHSVSSNIVVLLSEKARLLRLAYPSHIILGQRVCCRCNGYSSGNSTSPGPLIKASWPRTAVIKREPG